MNLKVRIKKIIPPRYLNRILLKNPWLYRTSFINYETNLAAQQGIEDLISQLDLTLSIEGDIVECGSSRCGATIIMAKHLKSKQAKKVIYACDSFEGFDRKELQLERQAGFTTVDDNAFTSTSYEYVKEKIKLLEVEDYIIPVKGYFRNTIPTLDIAVSFSLIDCDLKESVLFCAEEVWKRLSKNGRILFDDYTSDEFLGARQGIDLFVKQHSEEINSYGLLNRLFYVCKK